MTKINWRMLILISFVAIVAAYIILLYVAGDKPHKGSLTAYPGPTKVTVTSDREYIDNLAKAKKYEITGNIEKAIIIYELTSKTNRLNMPSYYPLLDMARLECRLGRHEQAVEHINTFLLNADAELTPDWQSTLFIIEHNTSEQIETVKYLVETAKRLKNECRKGQRR